MAEEVNAAQCKITIRYHRPAQSFAQKTESRTKIQSALPKDLDAQVFGYFDLLESKAADGNSKQIQCAMTKRGYRSGADRKRPGMEEWVGLRGLDARHRAWKVSFEVRGVEPGKPFVMKRFVQDEPLRS